jgi:hypothetical protein
MRTCPRGDQDNPEEARFCLLWGEPLVEPDPSKGIDSLREAADALEQLGVPVQHARVRVALARAEQRVGLDPAVSLERARSILEASGARFYLPEVHALAAAA